MPCLFCMGLRAQLVEVRPGGPGYHVRHRTALGLEGGGWGQPEFPGWVFGSHRHPQSQSQGASRCLWAIFLGLGL